MRVGAVAGNATEDTDRNLETADRLVRQAAGRSGPRWSCSPRSGACSGPTST